MQFCKVQGLFDTGSAVCLIKKTVVEKFGLPVVLHKQNLFVYGTVNQLSVIVTQKTPCTVSIDSINEKVDMLIVDDKLQTYDIIISQTLIEKKNVRFMKTDHGIRFCYVDEWPFSELEATKASVFKVKCKKDTEAEANSVNIIEVETQNEKFKMLLRNEKATSVKLNEGECLGRMKTLK